MKTLYIIRGLPGSGKSTYAKALAEKHGIEYYEADMYFMRHGEYKFVPSLLAAAHEDCFRNVDNAIHNGLSVIVSNTFTTQKEMDEYVHSGLWHGFNVKIVEMTGNYGSIHNVPVASLEKMRNRFVPNEKLIWYTEREEFPAFKNVEFSRV